MKKKILALCLIVALAATAAIGGTLAYFTDRDEQTNTFTVGKVGLDLTEVVSGIPGFADVNVGYDNDGAQYKVMPGVQYAKQPHITMDADCEPAYVFVELTFSPAKPLWDAIGDDEADQNMLKELLVNYNEAIFAGDKLEQNLMGRNIDYENDTYTEVYACGVHAANETFTLFDGVKIPENLENQDLPMISFKIRASAIQKEGIATQEDAYAKLGYTWTK